MPLSGSQCLPAFWPQHLGQHLWRQSLFPVFLRTCPLSCLIGHAPSSLRTYEVSHVHLPWCVSIATKGLTLGSLGRRKIIRLKMSMATGGWAAGGGGLQAQRRLRAPSLVPCLPRESELGINLHSWNKKSARFSASWDAFKVTGQPEQPFWYCSLPHATPSLLSPEWDKCSRLPVSLPTRFVTIPGTSSSSLATLCNGPLS